MLNSSTQHQFRGNCSINLMKFSKKSVLIHSHKKGVGIDQILLTFHLTPSGDSWMPSKNKQHKNDPNIKITNVILFVVSGEEDQFVVDLFYHMNNLSSSVCGLQTSEKTALSHCLWAKVVSSIAQSKHCPFPF